MLEVAFMPIFVASFVTTVLGILWFHPEFFGKKKGVNWESGTYRVSGSKRILKEVFVLFFSAMVIAYVMNHFGIAWSVFDWIGGAELGVWTWIGFVAPIFSSTFVLSESRPSRHYVVSAGFWLISFVLIGIILVILSQ